MRNCSECVIRSPFDAGTKTAPAAQILTERLPNCRIVEEATTVCYNAPIEQVAADMSGQEKMREQVLEKRLKIGSVRHSTP